MNFMNASKGVRCTLYIDTIQNLFDYVVQRFYMLYSLTMKNKYKMPLNDDYVKGVRYGRSEVTSFHLCYYIM